MDTPNVSDLCQRLDYTFRNEHLLLQALTHTSYSNEHPTQGTGHNERLEFLGDAVLDFVISDQLMRRHPELPEGDLTRMRASLVSEPALATIARNIELGRFLRMGKGERRSGGDDKDSLLSDALEALIAAIYLDSSPHGGDEEIQRILLHLFGAALDFTRGPETLEDHKTTLQEWVQGVHKDTVRYAIVREVGPDHDKSFLAAVFFQEKELGRGEGRSKKSAEQEAARQALNTLRAENAP